MGRGILRHRITEMERLTIRGYWMLRCSCGEVLGPRDDALTLNRDHELHVIDQYHANDEGRPASNIRSLSVVRWGDSKRPGAVVAAPAVASPYVRGTGMKNHTARAVSVAP